MFSFFRKRDPKPVFDADPMPDEPFTVIGDVHGSDGLLERLFTQLESETAAAKIICVGDYVDRGENSAEVINFLIAKQKEDPDRLICLMGNHERMMLDFLDEPTRAGPRWMRYGGLQTVASFHLHPPSAGATDDDWFMLRDQLESILGVERETWLRALPLSWQSGNVAVVHAAADPGVAVQDQSPRSLLWGHPDFETTQRGDNTWIVHGHTIVPKPYMDQGRIAIDTGAYATGRLTAALITQGQVLFHNT